METLNLIYQFCVVLIGLIIFFMKITVPNWFIQLIFKTTGKVVSLFVIAYAIVQIFKHFHVI